MPQAHTDRRDTLLPAGRRWGFGAHSVVPYLTHAVHSRTTRAAEVEQEAQFILNPVFLHMEHTLRALRHRS